MDQHEKSFADYHKKHDPEINASTSLPSGETVRVPTIWVLEAFPPALINNLQNGADQLGWTNSDSQVNSDFPDVISDMRSQLRGGGWLNLGYIVPLGSKQTLSLNREAPLPSGISAIRASIFQPFPSTTLLCCQFMLDANLASSLEQPLADTYNTYSEAIGESSVRFIDVGHQKQQAVEVMRAYLRSLCTDWVTQYFPGYFSSDLGGNAVPTCELILFSKQEDFSDLIYSRVNPNFLQMLNLDASGDIWVSKELSNLNLQIAERRNQAPGRAVIFGNVNNILSNQDLKSYGDTREMQVIHWLAYLDHTLGTWALELIAQDFVAEMGRTRDKYGSLDASISNANTEKIRELDSRLLEFQRNAIPFAYDVAAYCEHIGFFMHEVYEFQSTRKWGDQELKLFDGVKYRLSLSATHIKDTEQQIRAIAAQTGRIISAIANEKLAFSNLRLQKGMLWMTIVMLFLTVIMAQQQLKDFWYWVSKVQF